MKYLMYVTRRYVLTVVCKVAAVLATAFKKTWSFEFLDKSLRKRDEMLCREAKFCMQKTVIWQRNAQKCIIAHNEYEKELRKNQKKEN